MPDWKWLALLALVYWGGRWLLKRAAFNGYRDVLYVRLKANHMHVRNVRTQQEAELLADPGFSHPRTVLGNFSVAEPLLRQLVTQVAIGRVLRLAPQILLHPQEKLDGGLTQIEERALQELALAAGAGVVKIWLGAELADPEVRAQFKE